MSSVRLSTLQELMRRRRSIFVLAMCIACLSLRSVNACSVSDDFVFATHQDQWLAAAFVVEGTATEVDYDYDYDYDYDGGTTVLLTEDIATTKGSNLGCKTILVSGFTDSALCGLEPPAEGTTGTYYLCSLTVDENGDCTAEINSQGVFTGFTPAVSLGEADPSTAPSTCPQEPDVCQPVANCKPAPTPSPTPSPTPAPTPAPTPPPTPTSPVWPPTIDSECVNLDVQSSIRPTSDGSVAWLLSYNNVDRCFKKCRRPQGYTHIVEDRDTGKCFCYNAENSQEWEITEEDIGQEVLYSIEECFKMPTKRCPTDRPGWIDNPGFACKKPKQNGFVLMVGDTYHQYNQEKMYSGSVDDCKAICEGVDSGDVSIAGCPFNSCSVINHRPKNGNCLLVAEGKCNLREKEAILSSIYCG